MLYNCAEHVMVHKRCEGIDVCVLIVGIDVMFSEALIAKSFNLKRTLPHLYASASTRKPSL